MRTRRFGRSGFQVSEVGFGCWQIGGTMWGATDVAEATAAMRRAIELGVNFFDTALVYGMGRSEELVGKVFRDLPKRHEITVGTKIPPKNMTWPASSSTPLAQAYPGDHIRSSLETSLRNLGMERVDLVQLHVWADEWAAHDELWRTLEDLKKVGKLRAVGISLNAGRPATGVIAVESGHIDSVQVVYNLFDQQPEDVLFPACEKHNVGVIARVPFDEGGLTGRLVGDEVFADDDFRKRYFAGDLLRETVHRADELRALLVKDDVPDLAAAALRFCLSNPVVSTVIPGMRRSSHVESNVRAANAGPLPVAVLEKIAPHRWTPRAHD